MSGVHAKVFWSGGSQAVRLPKAVRVVGREVLVKKRGAELVLEIIPDRDDWTGFWDALAPLKNPVRRRQPRRAEKRGPV